MSGPLQPATRSLPIDTIRSLYARILVEISGLAVVVLTMLEDGDSVFATVRPGARGYVVKGADERSCCVSSAPSRPPMRSPALQSPSD